MPNTIHAHPVFNDCVRFPFSFNYERVWIIVKREKKRGQIVTNVIDILSEGTFKSEERPDESGRRDCLAFTEAKHA